MAKRSQTPVPSKLNDDTVSSDTLDIPTSVPYTIEEQSVQVVCKFPATLKLVGKVSGKQYEWANAGAIVAVDKEDVPDILTKKMGQSVCCGNNNNSTLFEVV